MQYNTGNIFDFTASLGALHIVIDRHIAGIIATVALHLALIAAWKLAQDTPLSSPSSDAILVQWIERKPQLLELPPPPKLAPRVVAPARVVPAPSAPRPMPMLETPPSPPTTTPAPALSGASHILEQARLSIGKIDRDLRKAYPGPAIKAPVSTPHTRLAQGIAAAADAAPNRWFEASKVAEIIDPGGYGRRRYKVVGANGTYCITVESNHAPDGLDTMKNGIQQKVTNCPEHESAATKQKW